MHNVKMRNFNVMHDLNILYHDFNHALCKNP